jgi:hypothetical protein
VTDILGGGPRRETRSSNDQVDADATGVQPIDLGPIDLDASGVPQVTDADLREAERANA